MGSKKSTSSQAGNNKENKNQQSSEVKKGINVVRTKLGITEMKHGPMDYLQTKKGTKDVLALKLKDTKGGTEKFGQETSRATNEYLVSIGEAKRGKEYLDSMGRPTGTYSYSLTSKGKQMKYGKSGGAMGSGDPSGIMTSVPISETMFESQKKFQTAALAGMSFMFPQTPLGMFSKTVSRAVAADTYQRPYSDYISTFYKGQSGEKNFAQAKDFANKSQDTANLAMGTIDSGKEKKSTKFTKKTSKYFAGSYSDQSKKKRKLFATV